MLFNKLAVVVATALAGSIASNAAVIEARQTYVASADCTYVLAAQSAVPTGTNLEAEFNSILVFKLLGIYSSLFSGNATITGPDASNVYTVQKEFKVETGTDSDLEAVLTGWQGETLVSTSTSVSYDLSSVTC